jgi:hypothetical protein
LKNTYTAIVDTTVPCLWETAKRLLMQESAPR